VITQGPVSPDSVRAVLKAVFRDPAYAPTHRLDLLGVVKRWLGWLAEQLDRLATRQPALFYALLIALVAVLVAILVHVGYIVWRSVRARQRDEVEGPVAARRARDAAWHLAEFRRLAAAGRYTEALAHRFMALVVGLHAQAALKFDASRTPSEQARVVPLDAAGRAMIERLVDDLYRRLFGGVPCTADDLGVFDGLAAQVEAHGAAR
jgi:hypothetical protein